MQTINFVVNGKIRGKGRPRFVRSKNFVRAYTDRRTLSYEKLVRMSASPFITKPFLGPVTVVIKAFFEIPSSISKKEREERIKTSRHTQKSDCDNICKAVCDALNGLAFKDDAQVSDLLIIKRWTEGQERLEIEISGDSAS